MSLSLRFCTNLLVGCAFICFLGSAHGEVVELFVAKDGNDANSGTKPAPFASLERVRDEAAKWQGSNVAVKVLLRAGDYGCQKSLLISGLQSVAWEAYQGERVRLLGGRVLPPSAFGPVTNAELRARLAEPARDRVLMAKVGTGKADEFGQMKSRGFARPTTPSHCELFYEGKPMILARWPNEGEFERIAGFPEGAGQDDQHRGQIGKLESGFLYAGERPRAWKEPTNAWVHGYWSWDWANSYERVKEIDVEKRLVRTAPPYGNYGFRKGQRFHFLNVLEELDAPGEWYLDPKNGVLYFWPPNGVDNGNLTGEIILSLLEGPLVRIERATNVVFRNLAFEGSRGNAVEIEAGRSNRVERCTIRNIGNWGVKIAGGFGHGVAGCEILDTGDGGVSMSGGDRQTLTGGGHFVEDCRFARQGRWTKCYVPAVLMSGVGLRVSHCLIRDHPHCGILFNGNDHLVEFNEIHRIALETGDVGAIYTGRDYTWRGNRIRHNFIHHTGGVGMGSMGVYMDDCVSGTEIYGNIFYKVQRAAFLGGGRDHRVVNNVFVECDHAVELDGRGLDKSPVWRNMVGKFMRERLRQVPPGLYRERYPEIKSLDAFYGSPGGPPLKEDEFEGIPPANNLVAQNVCVGKWLKVYWHASAENPAMITVRDNLTDRDPLFAGVPSDTATAKDFALRPESAAWNLGFKAIPVEQIGPRKMEKQE